MRPAAAVRDADVIKTVRRNAVVQEHIVPIVIGGIGNVGVIDIPAINSDVCLHVLWSLSHRQRKDFVLSSINLVPVFISRWKNNRIHASLRHQGGITRIVVIFINILHRHKLAGEGVRLDVGLIVPLMHFNIISAWRINIIVQEDILTVVIGVVSYIDIVRIIIIDGNIAPHLQRRLGDAERKPSLARNLHPVPVFIPLPADPGIRYGAVGRNERCFTQGVIWLVDIFCRDKIEEQSIGTFMRLAIPVVNFDVVPASLNKLVIRKPLPVILG